MSFKVDNAIILAAGFANRFVPLSYEKHKALLTVCGEVLIERQIVQLQEAGINDVYIVVGYKKEDFSYLTVKYGVKLIENPNYLTMNNISSIYAARDVIKNSYICSSDNYFVNNPFEATVDGSYYSAVYADGATDEWCIYTDSDGYINDITVGGTNMWYMLGHVFWDERFSKTFLDLLEKEYPNSALSSMLWENFFLNHSDLLKMKVRRYPENFIYEFDTVDELRGFDNSYITDSRCKIIKSVADALGCSEEKLVSFCPCEDREKFGFSLNGEKYICRLNDGCSVNKIIKL